jgi:hypothetical protein
MNMFKPVGAKSDDEYIAMLTEDRREAIETLDKLIKDTVPGMKRWFAYNMLGYGKFKYIDYKKQENEWPVIALASQKQHLSLYVCAIDRDDESQYLAEKYENELYKDGVKPNVGKSCIGFRRLEDLDLEVVKKVLKEAEKMPGLVGAKKK